MTFFILGNNPALSTAEIINIYKGRNLINGKNFALMDREIDAEEEIKKLGGIIKIGKTITEIPLAKANKELLGDKILKYLNLLFKENKLAKQNKISFGFSFYGYKEKFPKKVFIKDIAMVIKKHLKEEGMNARWVVSREENLSSAAVQKNNLFIKKNGMEIVFLVYKETLFMGATEAVQDFSQYSELDYGRPSRNGYSGMLPPKLAKMMINFSECPKGKSLLDPFCGSGTILQEALLMGYKKITGSDMKESAIESAEKNLEWIKSKMQNLELDDVSLNLVKISAEKLSSAFGLNSIDAIITEPYLGPPIRKDAGMSISEITKNLTKIYLKTFRNFKEILKKNGAIVMVFPIFKSLDDSEDRYYKFMQIITEIEEYGFELVDLIPNTIADELIDLYGKNSISKRKTLIYSRPDQYVLREIVKFRKK
ncbi:MAG: methyltransferase domain-containing protein [bacterium]